MAVAAAQVHSVRLRRDRICVALEHKVLVYNFADLRLLHSIETLSNPGGILALSAAAEQTILACPGLHVGQVPHPLPPRAQSCGLRQSRDPILELLACSERLSGRTRSTASHKPDHGMQNPTSKACARCHSLAE